MCSQNFLEVFKTLKLTCMQEVMAFRILKDRLNSNVTCQERHQKQTVFCPPTSLFIPQKKTPIISSDLNLQRLLWHILQVVKFSLHIYLWPSSHMKNNFKKKSMQRNGLIAWENKGWFLVYSSKEMSVKW